jgi:hypothetical protein
MGVRGRALSIFPSGAGLEWLRGLGAGLIGGGAPVAAKVGAVVATATIVGGGTVAVEKTAQHHAHRATLTVVPRPPGGTHAARPTSLATEALQVTATTAAPLHDAREASSGERQTSHRSGTKEQEAEQIAEHDGPSSSDDSASNGDGEHTTTTTKQEDSERTSSREGSGRSSDTHPVETHPVETQPVETQPTETQPTETQPTETQPTETQPPEPQDSPEHTSTTSSTPATATTSAELTTPPPTLAVVTVSRD